MSDTDINRFILDKLEKVDDKVEGLKVETAKLKQAFTNHEHVDKEIHDSIKEMAEKFNIQLNSMSQLMSQYNGLLKNHIRRTDIAELNIDEIKKAMQPLIKEFQQERLLKETAERQSIEQNIKLKTMVSRLTIGSLGLGIIISILKIFEIF